MLNFSNTFFKTFSSIKFFGLKEALVEVNKQELSLLKKVRILEEQIVELEKEDKE